jgi:hypothetical protein
VVWWASHQSASFKKAKTDNTGNLGEEPERFTRRVLCLLLLESYDVDVADLCRNCPELRRGRWQAPAKLADKVVFIDDRRFVERSDGWYHCAQDGRFIRILDAIIRVERVEPAAKPQRQIYHGVVVYRGDRIPFAVTIGPRYRLARAVKDFLLERGKGSLFMSIQHHRYLEELAFLFSPLPTASRSSG